MDIGRIRQGDCRVRVKNFVEVLDNFSDIWQELSLLRKLVLNGQWEKAESLLKPLESISLKDFSKAS